MRPLAALTVLVIVFPLTGAAQSPTTQPAKIPPHVEQVLKYVPDDAHLVVVIPSLDSLAAGVSAFGKTIGVPDLADVTALDVLEERLDKSAAALNTAGAVVVATSAKYDEPLLIASLTSDEDWKSTTKPATLRDGVLMYEFGRERYVAASIDNVAIFARERSELDRALDSTGRCAARVIKEAGELLGRRQVVLYVDVPDWSDEIEAQTTLCVQGLYMGMAAAGPDAEVGMQIWNWMLERFKKIVSEAQTYVATLRIDATGVAVDTRATFKPEGSVARYLKQVRKPKRDLLRGLPATESPIVFAVEWEDSPGAEGFNEALTKAVLSMDALKEKVGSEKLEAILNKNIELNRKVPGTSAAFGISPEGQGLLYWGLYLTDEGPTVRREVRTLCEATPELMNAWGTFPTAMLPYEQETIGGVEADVYQFNLGAEDSPLQPMVQAVYGKDPTLYMAAHPEGVAYAFGPRSAARNKLAEILTRDAAPLSRDPRVMDLLGTLSADPQFCVLIDIPRLAKTVTQILERLGLPVPPWEPGDQSHPLAGLTFYLEPEAVRAELFVPAEPIKVLIELVRELEGAADEAY